MDLNKEIERLNKMAFDQAVIIAELQVRLARYENPKNSRNSSIPPSHDYSRPTKAQSLREPSGKNLGGQPGHEGATLEMVVNPDGIIEHSPQYCNCCGRDISQIHAELVESRQEVVLPEIQPIIIEHRAFQKTCT